MSRDWRGGAAAAPLPAGRRAERREAAAGPPAPRCGAGRSMETPAENPSKAAEYLKELNKIIETQQELLEKQKLRIDELEQQVAKLYHENARLQDEHQRHLATCRRLGLGLGLQQQQDGALPAPPPPGQDNAKEEK